MTCERYGNMIACSRGGQHSQRPSDSKTTHIWKPGDRVTAFGERHVAAVVLQVKAAPWANGQLCKLRIAMKNPFAGEPWAIQEYRDWVGGTLLVPRNGCTIVGLDLEEIQ